MSRYVTDDTEKPTGDACAAFGTFWKEFGRALKLGVLEDDNNRCGCVLCFNRVGCFVAYYSKQVTMCIYGLQLSPVN
jgi:hypothetical protein